MTFSANHSSVRNTNDVRREYIKMRLDGQLFGMDVMQFEDILLPQAITPVPLSSPKVLGVLNLRGRIVTAIDLREILDIPMPTSSADKEKYRSVVVSVDDELYSFHLDQVSEVINIAAKDIAENPENLSERWKDVSLGVHTLKNELMVILDVYKLLGLKSAKHEGKQ